MNRKERKKKEKVPSYVSNHFFSFNFLFFSLNVFSLFNYILFVCVDDSLFYYIDYMHSMYNMTI